MSIRKRKLNGLKPRIAQRKQSSALGLYKILNRDKFFARSYTGTKTPMVLIDVSTTGCAFKVNGYVPKGSYIAVELGMLSERHIFEPPLRATCESVYCKELDNVYKRIGAKFVEIDRGDVDRIRAYTE